MCRFKQGDRVCRKCYARRWKGRKTFQTALARMERWFLENPEEILAEHHTCCCGPDGCDGPMMLRFDCWDGNAVRDGLMLDDAAMYLVENFSPDHYVWTCMEHAGLLVPETEVDVLAARIRWLEFLLGRR